MTDQYPAERGEEHERVRAAYARRAAEPNAWWVPHLIQILQERERVTLSLLRDEGFTGLEVLRILDVGCGRGYWLRELIKWGASPALLHGIDLLEDRVREAEVLGPPGITWHSGSAAQLPFAAAQFDLVMQSTVLSSVLDPDLRAGIAAEMGRVLAPGGAVLWYDFTYDNPRNRDVTGIPRREIVRLFPAWTLHLRRVTLAPPIARRIPAALYPFFTFFPFLRTHYVGVLRPPGQGPTPGSRGVTSRP
jgi:SAM-dependent methyltransferase